MQDITQNTSTKIADLARNIVEQAKKHKTTAAEVTISLDSSLAVNVHKNNVETLEQSDTRNITTRVYCGKHSGTASTSDWSDNAIKNMLEKASNIARFTEEDPYIGLADKQLIAYDHPKLELAYPWHITPEDAVEIAKNCEACGLSYDKRITNSEGSAVDTTMSLCAYANSHDFCGTIALTQHSISCILIATQQQEMQRDYYYTIARDSKDLANYTEIASQAARRTINRLGARKIPTQKCPIIFAAEIASSLIGNFLRAIDGYNLYRQASFLLDHLHKPVFANTITITEDPFIPKALGSIPFDTEGVKLQRSNIVESGILQRYILDSYASRKLKMSTTGNAGGIHNILVKPGSLEFSGLLKKMDKGLLITEFMGGEVNIVTGNYSRGVFGYWIEHGEIQYPVTGVTVAGNLRDMLLGIVDVGTDIDSRNKILTGSILVDTMTVAGE